VALAGAAKAVDATEARSERSLDHGMVVDVEQSLGLGHALLGKPIAPRDTHGAMKPRAEVLPFQADYGRGFLGGDRPVDILDHERKQPTQPPIVSKGVAASANLNAACLGALRCLPGDSERIG
jgi:hypothetical protein